MIDKAAHAPVLCQEVVDALAPATDSLIVDGTFGAGGYSRAVLEAAGCRVIGVDRDPSVRPLAATLQQHFPGFRFLSGRFGQLVELLAELGITQIDGLMLDLGVSSMQLDIAERGFSFRADGPLDMRMGQGETTAASLLERLSRDELANLIYRYGDEPASRRIARAIVERRVRQPFTRTLDLADVVRSVVPARGARIDPATKTFQALRIAVNDEVGELERGLEAAEQLLAPGGRLVVVTFHSLEDRIVKQFLQRRSRPPARPSRHMPEETQPAVQAPRFKLINRKPITPGPAEVSRNARARSARLRAAMRLADRGDDQSEAWERAA